MTTDSDNSNRYSTDISAGGLLIRDSRNVALLLMEGLTPNEIKSRVIGENLFQVRSQSSSIRRLPLLLNRLQCLDKGILSMITGTDSVLATQALLACAVKHSRLIGDFMLKVIGPRIRIINDKLTDRDWENYLDSCVDVAPQLQRFSESTRKKLRQIVFTILVESKYLESQKTRRLTPVRVEPELKSFLIKHDEKYVLKCLEVCE